VCVCVCVCVCVFTVNSHANLIRIHVHFQCVQTHRQLVDVDLHSLTAYLTLPFPCSFPCWRCHGLSFVRSRPAKSVHHHCGFPTCEYRTKFLVVDDRVFNNDLKNYCSFMSIEAWLNCAGSLLYHDCAVSA